MKKRNLKKPIISALEQRILFDGAAIATAVDALDESSFSSNNNNPQATSTQNDVTQNNAENSVHKIQVQAVQGFETTRREVAFIDMTVKDYQTLVDGVGEGVEVYLVSSLDDINSILKSETNIDAIHILSHGNVGEISVGNDVLNQNTLNNFDAVLQTMKNSLSENGDILLYGCNVANDGTGQEFINTLASITEADVAASNDVTGNSSVNGNWDLEIETGSIETSTIVVENYSSRLADVTYTENDSATLVANNVTISSGTNFSGGYVEFSLSESTSTETLSLVKEITASTTNGQISIVGNGVYIGNGTVAILVGSIDNTYNGENGQKLRINFSNTFANGNFSDTTATQTGTVVDISGWTIYLQQLMLGQNGVAGTSTIDGWATPIDSSPTPSNPKNSSQVSRGDDYTPSGPVYSYAFEDGGLRLYSSGMTTAAGGDIVHGPYVVSDSTVTLSSGDSVSFDWKAQGGDDAYDIYAYLLNVDTGATVELLNQTGVGTSATAWATKNTNINTAGTYKFVFVSGTFDETFGKAAGASLYIDNIIVTQAVMPPAISGSVLQYITRNLTYHNSSETLNIVGETKNISINGITSGGITDVSLSRSMEIIGVNDLPYISGKETVTVNEDTSITISGLTVGDKDIGGGNLTVTIDANNGTLSLGNSAGVTTSWDAVNKTLKITGTVTNLNNALATLRYQGDSNWSGQDPLTITINDGQGSGEQPYRINQTGKFFNPDNGHYYEFVSASGITWDQAKTNAESRTLYGLNGYLVTITSDSENTLITSMSGGNGWIGASDAENEGTWKWVTGPEAGTQFWAGDPNAGTSSTTKYGSSFNGEYSNWANNEPNNSDSSRGGEDVAHFYYDGINAGKWNDFNANNTSSISGYIVEYGGYGGTLAAANLTVRVLIVNDLPVNNIPTARTTNEDVNIVFSTANGNAISISDNDALNDPSVILTTTLSIGSGKGTLTLSEGSGATITNNGSTTVQITGTVAQINASLEGLTYTPTLNANGTAYTTLVITTNDGIATDTDSVIINITPVDDKPVANAMAATVGPNSKQSFDQFQPNFTDIDNDVMTEAYQLEIISLPTVGKFQVYDGSGDKADDSNWIDISDISTLTQASGYTLQNGRLVISMANLNNYRFDAGDNSGQSTNVNWRVMTIGDTNDLTGWSNTATGVVTILDSNSNAAPIVNIYNGNDLLNNGSITITEDSSANSIKLIFSDDFTPEEYIQGIVSSSNTNLLDMSGISMIRSTTNSPGDTVTFTFTPKANMYGSTVITLGASDGDKTTTQSFTLNVTSVNEQAIVDNFTRTINEDTSFSFATINPADIYHDANDVNNNANVSAVDYNSQMAIIQDAMMNPSDTDKQAAKITAIETLVEANYFPQSFIIDTLPTNGDLYLDGIKIESTNYTIAIANLEKLVYQPDLNYFGTDSFTWHALDKEGLATTIKTATFTIDAVNDAPVITTPSVIQIVDSSGASINGTVNTSLVASDVDNVNLTYKIDSGAGVLVSTMVGTYGTLVINSSTGDYQFIPNQSAITALDANTTETFILNVSDGELSDTTTLTINITAAAETASTYIEQADSTLILTDTTINTEHFYGGGFIEFNLNSSTSSETLGIQKVTTPDITADTVSIVGNSVYLGNGTSASVIGQIDAVYNGENGQKLKINFSVDFANGNFNSANSSVGLLSSTTNAIVNIDGWTIVNGRVNLGVDTIAGLATPEDTTNPSRVVAATDKDGDTLRRETYYTYINNDGGNDNSIKMNSSLTSTSGYAIVRGPYIYSDSAVSLKVGDTVQFDWKAQGGGDAYDVFGYIVDVNNPSNYQIILNRTGANASAMTNWATESITVSTDGDYKFVFVSGSWDATGGKALGAQLYIDDVKVTQANPTAGLTSDVLEKIAQKVTYQNSSDLSATNGVLNKTVTITTSSGDSTPVVHSSTKALNIQEVNDSVTLVSSVSNIYYTDTDGVDNFSNTTGKLTATDADSGTTFTYGINGATSNGDGTVSKAGTYGTLTINSSTGEYTFVPNSNAINALSSNVTETFTFNVSDGSGSSDSKVLTINIESVNDAPLLGGVVSSPTFTENGAATLIDKTITITDLEGTSYDSGYVAFKISQNAQVEDKLSILNVGGISLSGNNVTYGGVIIGVVDSTYNGQNGKELRVNLNSNAYSSQVQALARAIAFSNPTDDLSSNARTIEIKVSDGGNGGETTARYSTKEAVVNIQTINDLPQISLGNESLIVEKSIVSNPNGMLPLGSMINFADLDGDILTVRIETTNYGSININDSILNGVNASSISGNNSRVVTLTGTIEQINTTLNASNGISYTAGFGNDFITPGADYLKVTATDDLGGVSTSQKLVMVLPAIPNAQSDNIIGKEDNDILIDIDSLILDVNDTNINYIFGTGTPDITDINGTVITAGTITAFDSSKYIYADYDINGDGNIDSTDTSKVIGFELTNGKLIFNNDRNLVDDRDFAQFTFIPNENWSGVETFLYKFSSDQKTSNIAQIAIFVTPVNDAPVVSIGNSSITINEDNSFVFNNTNAINLADIDAVDSTQILDLTLRVNEGKLELSQLSGLTVLEGANNTSIIKVQGTLTDLQTAINNLKYTPNQDYNGSDSLTIKLNDKSNVGEGNILEDEKTINITINAVNDAPVFTNQSENTVEGNTITGVLPASDVDSTSISFSVNGTAPTGFILNNDGSYSFDTSSYNYIGEGETDTIIIPINVRDAEGLVTTANFSVTITGTNDAPTIQIVDVSGIITDGIKLSDNGSITFVDLDLTDRPVATEVTKSVSAIGQDGITTLVLTEQQRSDIENAFNIVNVNTNTNNGTITWDYTISQDKINFLGKGEVVTAVFTISVIDDEGAIATQDVTVTIIGSNDAPTVSFENIDFKIPFGEVYTKDISPLFSDKDLTDKFKFEASNLPLGLTIDPNTGIISGRVAQSGNFVIVIKGIDSAGASVTRTYNMLVIAPPQIAEPVKPNLPSIPTNNDTNINNSTDGLNNFTTTNFSNIGVLNFNSNDGLSVDTGIGFLNTSNNLSTNGGELNSSTNQNGEIDGSSNNSSTNNTSNTNDSRGVLQANIDLNVLTNGQIVFNEANQDSFSIVGITIEDIKFENNYIEIKVVDTNLSQNFIVTQIDGTALPAGLFFDPRTGNISGTIPEDLEKLEISIKAINQDGTTRVLNLKLDLKELKKAQKNQVDADEKYMGLKEQIALENQKLDDYGSYLTRLFA
ncbi:DUF4347 domain-containing protein [Aliarcobacter cibarius]|uniref:DUF4347 domain-containing protein n=1 Tax=Aliarcobacter cibarius TaxID=255507 RepID=A0ABY2V7I4_9BACT|nr:DUF4347 domain-containing protein [Aliarcobacter cibarius]TLS96139.1 DUF4347 domain-containing protein [Aliarcobacter cibarius]TLS97084.1 DUF4347 domain-containing protein [Aliarcobacter cibarius]